MKSLKSIIDEIVNEALEDQIRQCPAPTQDLMLNTANRDRAIKTDFIK